MKIYHYDPLLRICTGVSEADESPLEPGVFLIPAFATEFPPLSKVPDGQYNYFDGDGWMLKDIPPPPEAEYSNPPTDEEWLEHIKLQAKALLMSTDWSQMQDVNALLENQQEFTAYRTAVRAIFFSPVKDPEWPAPPVAVWL